MEITTEDVKTLRSRTGAGIMDCKRALQESQGDMDKAVDLLRKWGFAVASKRAARETRQGLVETYIHGGGRIGAMVEVNCETDFVARTKEFRDLAHDLAMQVAAMAPKYLGKDDLPNGAEVNPAEVCLLEQLFIKDNNRAVKDLIVEAIAKTGENVRVRRFARFELGDEV